MANERIILGIDPGTTIMGFGLIKVVNKKMEFIQLNELILDADTHRVTFQDQPLKLGPTECKLLQYVLTHKERVHSRGQLLDRVWGDHVFIEERTVDVHVKRLREALGAAGVMVETVRGAGYRLTELVSVQSPLSEH
jgi:two-component system phosphate regulon response regulator PhoB